MEKAMTGARCWECGHTFKEGEFWWYYYHGDQDDRVCESCAKKLEHTDTAYAGSNVFTGKHNDPLDMKAFLKKYKNKKVY